MPLAVPADARSRRDVIDAVHALARQRLVTGTSGNVSARLSDGTILIILSGRDYARMCPRDLTIVRLDGAVVSAPFPPSSEVPLHLAIYPGDGRARGCSHGQAAAEMAELWRRAEPLSAYFEREIIPLG